ncbi:thioredoxin domain-containing protein [Halorussus sp. AFM4]|uniref:thioredoxin domain-containing protein n=1 Tax=Halorussus sp. AFM4 TaxID=3421651 RepID=UPI003EBAEBE2
MNDSAEETKVEWREWGEDAFAEAREADKPVLLSLSATWCAWCHEMDREAYSNPMVAANVNDSFVPVRVDVDRQPRVRERYNVGGFPSTVFCTPDGDLLTGATYLGVDGMRQVVQRVRDLWTHKGEDAARIPRSLREDPPAGELSPEIERLVAGQLGDKFDDGYGGWGDSEKFPLPRTVEFALKRERDQALGTLSAISQHLYDDYDGGFFRFAEGRDWTEVHHEKLGSTNAALVRAYANAYLYTGDETYRDPAERTVEYLTTTLWTGEAFAGSQAPGASDDDPDVSEYYGLSATDREAADPPAVDPTAYADVNAMAADALLTFHAYTDDDRARAYAERALDYVLTELVDDGEVTHFDASGLAGAETSESGLLADHAHLAGALATARQVTGDEEYLDAAREVADYALDELREDGDDSGAFVDGPRDGPGLLDRPLRPLDHNAELADALTDLALLTGEDRYREAAEGAIAAFADAADRFGVQVASYATAAARLCRDPLVVEVADEAGSDLHRAALRIADHEKVVAPGVEGDGYEPGAAYVVVDGERSGPVTTPEELSERVAELTE